MRPTIKNVAPEALASLNSNRAARQLCERFGEMGALRELTARLHASHQIATGARATGRGGQYTFALTEWFLMVFGLKALRALLNREQPELARENERLRRVGFHTR